ncbi:MAG: glycosyltransferase [Deltaproteobacteria bacterium]|nr:glycosyltransferase [Deltaproteobacteria bacterium]
MSSPVFSIIIATKNSEKYLPRCLSSILAQEYRGCEIIVQDGASTDGSLQLLEQYKNKIRLVSEPDSGIYNAWNKALTRAAGDWAIFLGADDCFAASQVLQQAQGHLANLGEAIEFAYGSLVRGRNMAPRYIIDSPLSTVYYSFLGNMGFPFAATFIRLSTLRRHGFDESYKIAGDLDFAARAISDSNIARIPVCVTYMEKGGLSDRPEHRDLLERERIRAIRQHIAPKAAMLAQAYIRHFCLETEQ